MTAGQRFAMSYRGDDFIADVKTELATTTFAPLGKYEPANDNFAGVKRYGKDGGFVGNHNHDAATVWQQPARMEDDPGYQEFERLANEQGVQHARPPSTDSGQFHGDNPHMEKTPEERLPSGLALLAGLPGYIYLGSPYSKYEAGYDAAARVVADSAATLMRQGLVVYSPIAHGHAVAAHGLPLTWDFWKRQCQPLIDSAAGLIVLTMAGWQESVGLQYEIEEFVRMGKPILHVSPRWLMENEVGRAAA